MSCTCFVKKACSPLRAMPWCWFSVAGRFSNRPSTELKRWCPWLVGRWADERECPFILFVNETWLHSSSFFLDLILYWFQLCSIVARQSCTLPRRFQHPPGPIHSHCSITSCIPCASLNTCFWRRTPAQGSGLKDMQTHFVPAGQPFDFGGRDGALCPGKEILEIY